MNKAWYALRRTIVPWKVDESLSELADFCKSNHVDEVIIKVDTEEFTHGIPPIEWLDAYLPVLHRTKSELTRAGVVFSINPWVTLVHCDRGRDFRATYPNIEIGTIVGHDGVECKACACPISPGWRRVTRELWNRYASTEPAVIWVEDDIRLLNHDPAKYGCFCDLHMREFSKRVGHNVSREELVSAMFALGQPHPYRAAWMEMNRELANDTVAFLAKSVHEVSPQTSLGLMSSAPNAHSIEGRNWNEFTTALADGKQLYARPCMSNYSEGSLRGLYESEFFLKQTVHCLGSGVNVQTEVENCPFTGYSKSRAFTFAQMAVSFVFGSDGVTMNLFDHLGSPIDDIDPGMGVMLREKKQYLNALAERCQGGAVSGVGILHVADGAQHVHNRPGAGFMGIAPDFQGWTETLSSLGLAWTFGDSPVKAITGQAFRCLDDAAIRKMLSGGVLIDLSAAACLEDLGYGDLIGINIKRQFHKNTEPIAAEEWFEPEFGGESRKYMSMTIPGLGGDPLLGDVEPAVGARVISRLVDPDTNAIYPFVTLYENSLGGRVAVYPLEATSSFGVAFLSPYRKQQISSVLNWLTKGTIPMEACGGEYPLAFRSDFADRTVAGTFNLTLDTWDSVELVLDSGGRTVKRIERLDESVAAWVEESAATITVDGKRLKIDIPRALAPLALAALTIWWSVRAQTR